jgi:hypothetical protein
MKPLSAARQTPCACRTRSALHPLHLGIRLSGRRFAPLHLHARTTGPERCGLDGQQTPIGDAGRILGTDRIIAFLLHHFYLLYVSLILFSAAELITGLCLMAGILTRGCGAGLDRPLSRACADVRVAGRNLHR